MKDFITILLEASIVGLCLIIIYYATDKLTGNKQSIYTLLFLSGFLFHMIFEYTGINLWYSIKYCNLISQ